MDKNSLAQGGIASIIFVGFLKGKSALILACKLEI